MAETKTRLGKRRCLIPGCDELVVVRANAAGTVSMNCPECDFSAFAKKGTQAAAKLTEGLDPSPGPAPAPAPPPRRGSEPFDLANLGKS